MQATTIFQNFENTIITEMIRRFILIHHVRELARSIFQHIDPPSCSDPDIPGFIFGEYRNIIGVHRIYIATFEMLKAYSVLRS